MEDFNRGFTKIPHDIYNILPLVDLTSRERKAIDLIIRLTYGCHLHWVKLKQAEFEAVCIRPSHIRAVLESLLKKQMIIKNDKTGEYRLNEEYITTKLTKIVNSRLEKLKVLVGKQIRILYSQSGNRELTKTETKKLQEKEESTYQISNTFSLPNEEESAIQSEQFSSAKYTSKINKYTSDKDRRFADKNLSFNEINPDKFDPGNNGEFAALEAWKKIEPHNKKSFVTTYLSAMRRGLPDHLFYEYTSEILQDPLIENGGAVFNQKVKDFFSNS